MSKNSKTLSVLLSRLYKIHNVKDADVSQGTGLTISYIWRLRKGLAKSPGMEVVKKLADYFKVPPSYFFNESPMDESIQEIALRASELDEAGRKALLDIAIHIKNLQEGRK